LDLWSRSERVFEPHKIYHFIGEVLVKSDVDLASVQQAKTNGNFMLEVTQQKQEKSVWHF